MPEAELLLRGTAWTSLLAWAAGEWHRTSAAGNDRSSRWAFTVGALALAAHTAVAFHVRHGWSHAAAWQETARQTEAMTGWAIGGGGLLVNYVFLGAWLAEALWWWLRPSSFRRRPKGLDRAVRAFFLFMFVNGAIVFVHGPMRILGIVAVLAVAWAWYRAWGAGEPHA
jgi:hypothetical protein